MITATKPSLNNQPSIGCCKAVIPDVRPPTERQLVNFSDSERAMIARFLEETAEYVDHNLFKKSNAEKLLFGSKNLSSERLAGEETPADELVSGDTVTLNTSQEILLFQRFNYARLQMASVIERYRGKSMSIEGLKELLLWGSRATASRAQIVQSNIPLVLAMAKRTRLSGLDFNELISEGNFALLRSVDKFDCSRGFKFSTYACRAILKSFSRVALRTSRYRGRFPTEFDPTLEKSDFVDRKRDNVEADCVEEIRDILQQNRADLNDMEQTVIRERFALDNGPDQTKPKTLEQVGELIGVTKERVRQIQNKALRKIRAILEDNYLAA